MTGCNPANPMAPAWTPTWTEADRLAVLRGHHILDTPAEPDFDDIVGLAADICTAPIALIGFIDAGRLVLKAETGLGLREIACDSALCTTALQPRGLLIVRDLAADPCAGAFSAAVPTLRFYAGAVIETADRLPLGLIGVLDTQPRQGLSPAEARALRTLARQVMAQLELRRLLRVAQASEAAQARAMRERDTLLQEKDLLMAEAHHRVKNSLQLVQTLVTLQARDVRDPQARAQLAETAGRIMTIGAVHKRLYTGGSMTDSAAAPFLAGLVDDIQAAMGDAGKRPVDLQVEPLTLPADRLTSLGLVVTELVTNALKYGSGRILVGVRCVGEDVEVAVQDEGKGFPAGFDVARGGNLGMRLVAAMSVRGRQATRLEPHIAPSRIVTLLPRG